MIGTCIDSFNFVVGIDRSIVHPANRRSVLYDRHAASIFQYGLVVVLELRRCRRIGPPSIRCVATAVVAVVAERYVVLWSLLSLLLSISWDSNTDVFDTSGGNDDIVLIRRVSFFLSQIRASSPAVQLVVGVTGHQARTIPWWPPIKHWWSSQVAAGRVTAQVHIIAVHPDGHFIAHRPSNGWVLPRFLLMYLVPKHFDNRECTRLFDHPIYWRFPIRSNNKYRKRRSMCHWHHRKIQLCEWVYRYWWLFLRQDLRWVWSYCRYSRVRLLPPIGVVTFFRDEKSPVSQHHDGNLYSFPVAVVVVVVVLV